MHSFDLFLVSCSWFLVEKQDFSGKYLETRSAGVYTIYPIAMQERETRNEKPETVQIIKII